MRKVLIICQNFPPTNKTSSYRPYAWAKYLSDYGWEPIVVCQAADEKDKKISQYQNKFKVYDTNFEEGFFVQKSLASSKSNNKIIAKIFYYLHLLFEFSSFYNPSFKLYKTAEEAISEYPDIKAIVVTARPFLLFKVGCELSKKYNIPWFADYRDDWSTSSLQVGKSKWIESLFSIRNKGLEKKWVSTATGFMTVSPFYVKKIEDLLERKVEGSVVENGYFEEELIAMRNQPLMDKFTITYIGALYPTQNLTLFFTGLIKLFEAKEINSTNFEVVFVGTNPNRILNQKLYKESDCLKQLITIKDRVTKEESIKIQAASHLLLMLPHENIKGIPSSKIYEYIGLHKKVLVCPSDKDILEETLTATGLGIIADDLAALIDGVKDAMLNHNASSKKLEIINQYDRKNTTRQLAGLLDHHINVEEMISVN